jgi:hypothetical protein
MTTTGDATRLPDSVEQDLGGPLTAEPDEGRSRLSGKSVSAFRTISEVSAELDVPQHVLRFWESKFTQLRPPRVAAKDEAAAEPPKPEPRLMPVEVSLPGIPKAGAGESDVLLRELLNELKTLRALLD